MHDTDAKRFKEGAACRRASSDDAYDSCKLHAHIPYCGPATSSPIRWDRLYVVATPASVANAVTAFR